MKHKSTCTALSVSMLQSTDIPIYAHRRPHRTNILAICFGGRMRKTNTESVIPETSTQVFMLEGIPLNVQL